MQSTGPIRHDRLKLYIKGLMRAERRIIYGQRIAFGVGPDLSRFPAQADRIRHLAACYFRRGAEKYTESLMALRVCRSKLQAELEGLEWLA